MRRKLAMLSALWALASTARAGAPGDGSLLPSPATPSASNLGSTVSRDYYERRPFKFDGKIDRMTVQLD